MNLSNALKLLLNGIKSPSPIDPVMSSKLFGLLIDEIGGLYTEYDCGGYVILNDVDLMFVMWREDGVYFQDHNITDDTIRVIHTALKTIELLTDYDLESEDERSSSGEESSSDTVDCNIVYQDEDEESSSEWL